MMVACTRDTPNPLTPPLAAAKLEPGSSVRSSSAFT